MPKIPLKINISQNANHHDIKNALNLNSPPPAKKAKISVFWPLIALLFFCASLFLTGFFIIEKRQESWKYSDLIPKNYRAAAFLSLSQLPELGAPLVPEFEKKSLFFRWLKERALKFITDSGLKTGQIAALFEDDALITIIPQEEDDSNNWVFLAKIKPSQLAAKKDIFGKIELTLKKDFFLNEFSYRQIEIKSVHSLTDPNAPYFYALADDY
ncbi:MAG: hypothetical protein PHQ47_02995, partial [Candidatus Portnoybacteria bacterium]|nr:hypothetical protein [Candidatus Portnoybacteria bacterium]